MQYQILIMSVALAIALPSVSVRAAEVSSTWSAKALTMSSGRALSDGPNYSFVRTGSFGAAQVPVSAMVSSVSANNEVASVGDYLGNTSMFADFSASASTGQAFAAPGRVARTNSETASEARIPSNAGLSTGSDGFMTLLAGVGVVGFLAFKRGSGQSRY